MGRPLQPNPAGGPPIVPQALNRYAATPVGQPGVAEGAEQAGCLGNSLCSQFLNKAVGLGVDKTKDLALEVLSQTHWRLHSLPQWGKPIEETFTRKVRVQHSLEWIMPQNSAVPLKLPTIETMETLEEVPFLVRTIEPHWGAKLARSGWDNAFPFVVDTGFQLWQDWDNPRLPIGHKIRRSAIAGTAGLIAGRIVALVVPEATIPFLIGSAIFGIAVEGPLVTAFNNNMSISHLAWVTKRRGVSTAAIAVI